VHLILDLDGHGDKPSMTHAALGHDMLSEVMDGAQRPFQHSDLHAAVPALVRSRIASDRF
jgi:hypothetical protein